MDEKILDILVEVSGIEEIREERDINLFDNGFLDSLSLIQLLIEIEEQLGIKIEPTEIDRTDIETPNKIIDFLVKKR